MVINLIIFALSLFFAVASMAQTPVEITALQWAIKNRGEGQRFAIDHYTSGQIKGVVGEDIHLPPHTNSSGQKIAVAILDTGIDANHPDLKTRLAGSGFNFVENNATPTDVHGHGTHVAGLITSVSASAQVLAVKVVQTGPNAPIRPQEVEPGAGTALTENVAKGLEWAIQNNAKVINLSLAWPASIRSKAVDRAMKLAEEKKVIIVSSAGNDSTLANVYPCIYSQVICVGAHGPDGAFTHFSNYGPMVDLLAPGISILSTWPVNKAPATFIGQVGYEFRNGTSMAAPLVAGMVAELLSRGIAPDEARARILLGTRNSKAKSLLTHSLQGTFSTDKNLVVKGAHFGNADLTLALQVAPRALIVPSSKAPLDLIWDGVSPSITSEIQWVNRWVNSGPIKIEIGDESFESGGIPSGGTFTTRISVAVNSKTESLVYLRARVQGEALSIPVQIKRVLSPTRRLIGTSTEEILDLRADSYDSIRSVVAADGAPRLDLLFIKSVGKNLELQLVQGGKRIASADVKGLSSEQLLNPYRLPDQSYALIFTTKDANQRPNFLLQFYSADLQLQSEVKVGTEYTVLSENFKWVKSTDGYRPLWISLGYTPKLDAPNYDPWDPKYKDTKMLRIYSVSGNEVRTVKLEKTQLPLQVLAEGSVLIAEGRGYYLDYSVVRVDGLKLHDQTPLTLKEYRMLVGLEAAQKVVRVDGASTKSIALSGPSSPGNLRVTTLGSPENDDLLYRSSPLEALVQTVGIFSNSEGSSSYFVQSHYDLKFFRSGSNQTLSTSLNRYSYIPSMIFNRNFYPLITQSPTGERYPSMYSAASVANAETSEVLIADIPNDRIIKPAQFRIQAQGCTALGNFIAATPTAPAQLVFVCGNELIKLPLTIQK